MNTLKAKIIELDYLYCLKGLQRRGFMIFPFVKGVLAPVDPEDRVDFARDQLMVVRSGKPLKFGPGILFHGRSGLDRVLLEGKLAGDVPLTRVGHIWGVPNVRSAQEDWAVFVVRTSVYNSELEKGNAIFGIRGSRKLGVIDVEPEMKDLSLAKVAEIWVSEDTDLRYRSLLARTGTTAEQPLQKVLRNMYSRGKIRSIPGLMLSQLPVSFGDGNKAQERPDHVHNYTVGYVGRYMVIRRLFEQIPRLVTRE